MKNAHRIIAIAVLVIAILVVVNVMTAHAAATPVATATQVDASTFIFDASTSPCKWRYCTFSWRYYGTGTNRLGATLGFGPLVVYRFPGTGVYQVMVRETEFCSATSSTTCPGTAQVNVVSS